MTSEIENLRDKDHTVLQHIQNGDNDTQKITSNTTLKNHHVNYSLQKLEKLGLLKISKPEGTVERVINGQKRVFQHPKQAQLTDKGEQYLEESDQEDLDQYENLTHKELVHKVRELEQDINSLNRQFQIFQNQVKDHL